MSCFATRAATTFKTSSASSVSASPLLTGVPVVEAHLPSKQQCPFLFLQQLASGGKKYLTRHQVPPFIMPHWPELSVVRLWEDVQNDAAFAAYFPSQLPKGKLPEKPFFWGIVHAIKPGYAKALMTGAIEARNALPEEEAEDPTKTLVIQDPILAKMLTAPTYLSK